MRAINPSLSVFNSNIQIQTIQIDNAVIIIIHYVNESIFLWAIQWRSQPDNLIPLCKFEIIIIHLFRN